MARDIVAVSALAANTKLDQPTGTTISVANGAIINLVGNTDNVLIEYAGTAAKKLTVVAGGPSAPLAALGDLEVTSDGTNPDYFVLESARFAQDDGSIHINFEASAAGKLRAYRLPRGW